MAVQHSRKTAKTFIGELYEDDPSMQYAIEYLKTGAFSCCYIWHDKDVNESGLPKKKHLHFVLKYPCKTNISVIAKLLQIADNYIDTCNNETKSLLYLIHRGYEDKYQYDPEEVKGNGALYTRFTTLVEDESEDDRIMRILKLLEGVDHVITMTEFVKMCCEAGVYSELRRGGYLLAQVVKEHNDKYIYGNT